ncbi:hypothetical protein [Cyclobacterium sp.]|uniref:hypothetical protein n=1 Tax=Cyclobacterium sp. TaxID=1966343 RepID=UPI0019C3F8A3|nr:hypothetical protein [Cyclobacterium sp.]MBD3628758.1 hypothetical protein [Cyclobacterium sp.]
MEFAAEKNKARPIISRSNETTCLKGFHFESWAILQKQLDVACLSGDCVFSDLSLGAWKGHWVVHEICSQLAIERYDYLQPLIGVDSQGEEYASIISRLIDNESTGDQNFIIAYESCKRIISELVKQHIKCVVIISPLPGYSWERENIEFIQLLSEGLKTTSCKVVLLNFGDASFPLGWQVTYDFPRTDQRSPTGSFPIPGLIEGQLASKLQELIPPSSLILSRSHVVIAPSERKKETSNRSLFISRLKPIDDASHLRVYFEIQELTNDREIGFLQWEAARRFSEGGYAIALRILEAIRKKIPDKLKLASVVSQIQNIRIALMYFSEAANEAAPQEDLPNEYKASLYQSKAWGLVMTNRAPEAEPFFELAREHLSETDYPRVYLYLLNISALNKLKNGDVDAAFEFEREIENKLAQQKDIDWHILYINSINQARLYKKIKEFELAQTYYLKAFEVNNSLRVESDLLYFNFCFAQLEELKGNNNRAFIFWLRSSLHWLSNEHPEALAPRVAQAILGSGLSSNVVSVASISIQLKNALLSICRKMNLFFEAFEPNGMITFSRIERAGEHPEMALGTAGLGIMASSKVVRSVYNGPEYISLKGLTHSILCTLLPELKNYKTVYTDSQFGNELPVSSQELLSSCIRYQVSRIIFGEKKYHFTEKEQFEFLLSSKVRICQAIASVKRGENKLIVYFKRYRRPLTLTKTEKTILENIHLYSNVRSIYEAFNKDEFLLEVLRQMEEKRLITIFL